MLFVVVTFVVVVVVNVVVIILVVKDLLWGGFQSLFSMGTRAQHLAFCVCGV